MAQSSPSLLEIVSSTLDGTLPTASESETDVPRSTWQHASAAPATAPHSGAPVEGNHAVESGRQVGTSSVRPSQPPRDSTPSESNLARVWPNLKPGDLVAGKYRVERVQSHGRLLCAVQVRHLVLDTQATLKYLTPEAAAFPETIASFLRGARLLSQLHTPHVATVLDVGMLDMGTPYLVLEQPEGPDFAQVLRVRGALPIEEARLYVKQMCEGLAQAHALGLIHGSLRPGNVILTKRQDGRPIACVADFGSTNKFDFEELTRTDTGLSTPREILEAVRYLSPDHARFPDQLDARCDIWSLGAIFFELLVGEPAFTAKTPAGLLASIVADELPPLRTLRPDAPETLEAVLRCCLAKQREARLPNGSQLLRALEASDDFAELSRPTRSSLGSIAPGMSASGSPDAELKAPSTMPGIGSGSVPPPSVPALRVPVISTSAPLPPQVGDPNAHTTGAASAVQRRASTESDAADGSMAGLFRDEPRRATERVSSAAAMAVAAGLLVGGLAFVTLKLKAQTPVTPPPATVYVAAPPPAPGSVGPAPTQPAAAVPQAAVQHDAVPHDAVQHDAVQRDAVQPTRVQPAAEPAAAQPAPSIAPAPVAALKPVAATPNVRPTRPTAPPSQARSTPDDQDPATTTKATPAPPPASKKPATVAPKKSPAATSGDDPFGSF